MIGIVHYGEQGLPQGLGYGFVGIVRGKAEGPGHQFDRRPDCSPPDARQAGIVQNSVVC